MGVLDSNLTIVVIAYNRPLSLKRVLSSLNNAKYLDQNIRLVISIDKGDSNNYYEVVNVAEDYKWKNGEKIVIKHTENLGLREHVLRCGNLTDIYENVLILEDDLFVSEYFYSYLQAALEYYKNDTCIAGISLYKHEFNESASLPFISQKDESDVFFMQIPSSWGQLFTKKQWEEFKNWYKVNASYPLLEAEGLPKNVVNWPESSWKKYFQKYMIQTNKYFVYPYESHSTNFGDVGKHFWAENKTFQIPLSRGRKENYKFSNVKETLSVYDAFCENEKVFQFLKINESDLEVDLYGIKKLHRKRYLLSTQRLDYLKIGTFGLSLKPIEENVIKNIQGNDIFLYDISMKGKNSETYYSKVRFNINKFEYFYPGLNIKKTIPYTLNLYNLLQILKYLKKKLFKIKN